MSTSSLDPDQTHTRLAPVRVDPPDRRVRDRHPVRLPASLSAEQIDLSCDVQVLASVENASEGGLFIRSPFTGPRGTRVRVRVITPARALTVRGRVAWVAAERSSSAGVGIELDEDSRALWLAQGPLIA